MYRKIALALVLTFASAAFISQSPWLKGSDKEINIGAMSTCTFKVSLTISPCIQEIELQEEDEPDSVCFSAPGIESLDISLVDCPNARVQVKPEGNRFCMSKDERAVLMQTLKKKHDCEYDIIIMQPG